MTSDQRTTGWKALDEYGNYVRYFKGQLQACPMLRDGTRAMDDEACDVFEGDADVLCYKAAVALLATGPTDLPWEAYNGHDGGLGHWLILAKNTEIWGDVPRLVVAKIEDGWSGNNSPEAAANADLIVRACNAHDELLEALKEVCDVYGCECLDSEPRPHCPMCHGREVIAKAEGV